MTLELPPPLATMVAALNRHDSAAFTACFADDAVVRDEGQLYFGAAAIRTWFEKVSRQYEPRLEVTDLARVDGEPVLTGQVSGKFEGSPIALRYHLALEEGKIVALKIAP